jgi:hypothetical protein
LKVNVRECAYKKTLRLAGSQPARSSSRVIIIMLLPSEHHHHHRGIGTLATWPSSNEKVNRIDFNCMRLRAVEGTPTVTHESTTQFVPKKIICLAQLTTS